MKILTIVLHIVRVTRLDRISSVNAWAWTQIFGLARVSASEEDEEWNGYDYRWNGLWFFKE